MGTGLGASVAGGEGRRHLQTDPSGELLGNARLVDYDRAGHRGFIPFPFPEVRRFYLFTTRPRFAAAGPE